MKTDTESVERLREALLDRGRASSVPRAFPAGPAGDAAYERTRPFAEAMFLVMLADGAISESESEVLRGAMRTLSGDVLGTVATETMVGEFEVLLKRDGLDIRLDNVAAQLWSQTEDRELAFALVGAMAMADAKLHPEEGSVIYQLAERLGVSRKRAVELLSRAPSL